MKIKFFTINMCQVGGVERVLANLSNHIINNHDVEIVSVFSNGKRESIPFKLDYRIKTTFLKKDINYQKGGLRRLKEPFLYAKYLKEHLDFNECDISIMTNGILNSAGAILKNKVNCKIVGWEHSTYKQYTNFRNLLNIITYRSLDKLIVLTKGDANFYYKFVKNVDIIPNLKGFSSNSKSDLRQKKIISIGRLTNVKGFDLLIDSFKLIAENNREWSLDIVGSGEEDENLFGQIKRNSLEKQIKIIPFSNNIEEYYLRSSICVVPSRDESFSMVILEAKEFGIPCVAFESFGPSSLINNEVDGIIVQNGNIYELSNKLEKLMKNFELRNSMGICAKESAKKYKVDNICALWEKLFQEVINKN